jgi:hypothetical protein
MRPNDAAAKSFVWIGPIDGSDSIGGIDGRATEVRAKRIDDLLTAPGVATE